MNMHPLITLIGDRVTSRHLLKYLASLLLGAVLALLIAWVYVKIGRHSVFTDFVQEKPQPHAEQRAPVSPPWMARSDTPENLATFSAYLSKSLSKTHAPLFIALKCTVPAEKLALLQEVLLRRDLSIAEVRKGHIAGGADLRPIIAKLKSESEREIKRDLGGHVVEMVASFEASLAQRQIVDDVNRNLVYDGHSLVPQQIEAMIVLLNENRTRALPLDASLEKVDAYIESRREAHARITAAASPILSPEQLAAFKTEFEIELAYLHYYKMRKQELTLNR
jgi:hypothetical protein